MASGSRAPIRRSFRLRVGVDRIVVYDHADTIEILSVKHRSDAYR